MSVCAKNGRTDQDAILGVDLCESTQPFIRCGQDRTNLFAAMRGDRMAMWPFTRFVIISVYVTKSVYMTPKEL